MRFLLAITLFVTVASATPQTRTCEKKNEILKKAVFNLAKPTRDLADCSTCYDDILKAVTDCILEFDNWKTCVEDILGAGSPCIDCVCEVIGDISSIFGQDWSC